jgi:inorganic triphosphatase YgiF
MTHWAQKHGEVELKFELDGDAAEKVRRSALLSDADRRTHSQRSIYFDTDDGEVHQAGYSLRVRQDGKSFTQTVKTNGGSAGLFDRGEWEALVGRMAPDPRALRKTPLSRLKTLPVRAKPVVSSDVERTTWMVDLNGSMVEVALDSGSVSAGGRNAPLHELELELKDGSPTALFEFAHALGRAAPLQVGVISKEERGLMLAEGAFGHEQKASVANIRKRMDVGQVFVMIVHECVRHFRLNEALIVQQRDPEALHQARVAMRRLRTAFTLFAPAIRKSSVKPLRKDLQAFVAPFGDARNLDVFLATHGHELKAKDRRKVVAARAKAYDRLIQTLKAQASRDLLLNLVEWTVSGDWRKRAASAPIESFAARRLNSAWKNVKRNCGGLRDLDERHLHRLRISTKKLRYAVDFLAPLYAKKRVRKFGSALEDVQDCLGLIHDDMIGRQIASSLDLAGVELADAKGRSRQLRTIAKGFKHLKRAGRFWAS